MGQRTVKHSRRMAVKLRDFNSGKNSGIVWRNPTMPILRFLALRKILCKRYSTNVKGGVVLCAQIPLAAALLVGSGSMRARRT